MEEKYELAAQAIKNADALLVTAGAGMGCDSGLPDFRGDEGFWEAYPPYKKLEMSFESLANPRSFEDNPRLAWGFYGHRLNLYRTVKPHFGYKILKNWADRMPKGSFVFTSNVDGWFKKVGFELTSVLEVHGSIHLAQCVDCCGAGIFSATGFNVVVDETTMKAVGDLPKCPRCKGLARPNIRMFGDIEFLETMLERRETDFRAWTEKVENSSVVVVELGAGTYIPTVRWAGERFKKQGATLIRINPRDFYGATIGIQETALSALLKIDELVGQNN